VIKLPWPPRFQWDDGNRDKNRREHGISCEECEKVFWDPDLRIYPDDMHSEVEERYYAYGKNNFGKYLLVSFTMRYDEIRPISARRANEREQKKYGKPINEENAARAE
jgi:uncharacterized DUF497 family protein